MWLGKADVLWLHLLSVFCYPLLYLEFQSVQDNLDRAGEEGMPEDGILVSVL